ncbi:MAG TPA: hypothetical protein VIQ22_00790, partial [Gammaproteobacteria bacterium]
MDFATLRLVGDTTGLKKAEPALDAIVAKAGKAEGAVKRLGTATKATGTAAASSASGVKAAGLSMDMAEQQARQAAAAMAALRQNLDLMGIT